MMWLVPLPAPAVSVHSVLAVLVGSHSSLLKPVEVDQRMS